MYKGNRTGEKKSSRFSLYLFRRSSMTSSLFLPLPHCLSYRPTCQYEGEKEQDEIAKFTFSNEINVTFINSGKHDVACTCSQSSSSSSISTTYHNNKSERKAHVFPLNISSLSCWLNYLCSQSTVLSVWQWQCTYNRFIIHVCMYLYARFLESNFRDSVSFKWVFPYLSILKLLPL